MPDRYNFDLKLPAQPDPTLDQKLYREFQVVYNSLRLLADQVAGGNMAGWQQITADDIVVHGFSFFTHKQLIIRYLTYDTILVTFRFEGTSNSTITDFEVPVEASRDIYSSTGPLTDNGILLSSGGSIYLGEGSKIVTVYPDTAYGSWTSSGAKSVSGQFIYNIGV